MCAYCPHTSTGGPFLQAYSAVAGSTTVPRHERVLARASAGVARRGGGLWLRIRLPRRPSPPLSRCPSTSSASPCPLESVGAHTPAVLPWFTWWRGRRRRGKVLCPRCTPDPLGVPVRHAMQHSADDGSGFHAGKGGTEAEAHPRPKATWWAAQRRRGPCERSVRRSANGSGWTSIGPGR